MIIELISTGTELLRGTTLNTNVSSMGCELAKIGLEIDYVHTVGDDYTNMITALSTAVKRSDIVIITGGLGPTSDDITRNVVAQFFAKNLIVDDKLSSYLRYLWRSRHGAGHIPKAYFNQSQRIENAEFMRNECGSAPGQYLKDTYAQKERHIFLLPGPPAEFNMMTQNILIPKLKELTSSDKLTQGFLIAGIGELEIQSAITPQLKNLDIEIAYCASAEGTKVFVSGNPKTVTDALDIIRTEFQEESLPTNSLSIKEALVAKLREKNYQLGLAESCTGGLISAAITDVSGSSAVFQGGIVSYDNKVKMGLLGVAESTLIEHGAVSSQCAKEMALGAKHVLNVDIAGSVTGIAGPAGGSEDKPVGTVFMSIALPNGESKIVEYHFKGNRDSVRQRTCAKLLLELYKSL